MEIVSKIKDGFLSFLGGLFYVVGLCGIVVSASGFVYMIMRPKRRG